MSPSVSSAVERLLVELGSVVGRAIRDHEQADLFAGFEERFGQRPEARAVESHTKPVVDEWLAAAVESAGKPWRHLAELLAAASADIPWIATYENLEPSAGLDAFQPLYSFQLLVGPDFRGYQPPVLVDDLLAGFTLQAPNVLYPRHHHAPPEIYGVMSGAPDWQVGNTWSQKGAGDVIVHRPHESHAMRTGDRPTLSWAAWPRDPLSHVYMPSLDSPDDTMAPIVY